MLVLRLLLIGYENFTELYLSKELNLLSIDSVEGRYLK